MPSRLRFPFCPAPSCPLVRPLPAFSSPVRIPTDFTDGSLSSPSGVAVDLGGSVWTANQGNNSITRILGAAVPAAPLSTAAKNNTTGSKP